MKKGFKSIFKFFKSEAVLCVAWILAIVSMFFVKPDKKYFDYIDWRSLGILWSLMVVMNAFRQNGFFDMLSHKLLSSVKKTQMLILTLVLFCFVFSMLITNDVALITFVPLAILVLKNNALLIPTIVLQTVAANLGSMLTPIGNPQNLYLFALGDFAIFDFIKILLPYWILSLFLLIISVLLISKFHEKKSSLFFEIESEKIVSEKKSKKQKLSLLIFSLLFVLSILTVLKFIPFYILVPVVLIFALVVQVQTVLKADYFLLLTFVGFFIFTGNMSRIPSINIALENLVEGRELFIGLVTSQIISNVPAALLLSGFTKNISDLVLGVNLGGLGTLIASMASLISFKFYCKTENSKSGKYLIYFTIVNLIFLSLLIVAVLCFQK